MTHNKLFLPPLNDSAGQARRGPLSILLYGDTGSSKSYQVGRLAYRIYKETGKITRYLTFDGGGGLDTMQSFIDAGCISVVDGIEALRLQIGGTPLSPQNLIRAIGSGYWGQPRLTKDGRAIHMDRLTPEDYAHTGMYAMESLSSFSTCMEKHYIITQQKVGQDLVSVVVEQGICADGEQPVPQKFGKIGLGHYGGIQSFVLVELLPVMNAMPVEIVVLSTHESRGVDDLGAGEKVFGPLVIGKAATKPLMKSVAVMMHFDKYATAAVPAAVGVPAKPMGVEYRAYFVDHPDPQNNQIQWKSQPRIDPALMPELEQKYPGGYVKLVPAKLTPPVHPGVGIDDFLLERNALQRKLAESLKIK